MAVLGAVSRWLADTPLSHGIVTARWVIPTLQTIHILGVAVVFSSAVLVNLRIFGVFERDAPAAAVARRLLPPIWPVLGVLFVTGSLLVIGEPRRSLINPTFYVKMGLLSGAVAVTAGLQGMLSAAAGKAAGRPRVAGTALATLSILLWCGILFAGRFIAYTQGG